MCTLKLFFEAKQITLEKVLFSVIIWNHPLAVCSPHTGFPAGVENMGEGSSKLMGGEGGLSQYMGEHGGATNAAKKISVMEFI